MNSATRTDSVFRTLRSSRRSETASAGSSCCSKGIKRKRLLMMLMEDIRWMKAAHREIKNQYGVTLSKGRGLKKALEVMKRGSGDGRGVQTTMLSG